MSAEFDYSAPAELFFNRTAKRNVKMSYRRFATAAEALRFAVEDLGRGTLNFATLEVNEARFERGAIVRLYDAPGYPFVRNAVAA